MASEDLKGLNRNRGTLKSRLTLFKGFVTGLLTKIIEENQENEIGEENLMELEIRLDRINPVMEEFQEIQGKIEGLSENVDDQVNEREAFESEYYRQLSLATKIIKDYKEKSGVVENYSGSGRSGTNLNMNGIDSGRSVSNSETSNVRLPQIQFPKFSGNYETWMEFKDTFESLIQANSGIGDIQKFHYLRASLEGGAKQVIQSLEFSASNYKVAWKLLTDRYDNKRLLVHNHIKAIYDLPAMTQESSFGLRKFLDTLNKHLRALESLEQPTEHWDTLIIFSIAGKLDKESLREWETYKVTKDLPTLSDFNKFVKDRADLLETLELSQTVAKTKIHKENSRENSHKTKSFMTVNHDERPCALCGRSHRLAECEEFKGLSVEQRISELKKSKLCMCCFKPNHYSRFCSSNIRCKKCNYRHNVLVHLDRREISSGNITRTAARNQDRGNDVQGGTGDVDNRTATFSTQNTDESAEVILATALVYVRDESGAFQGCRCLLDCGSQSNYISSNFCKKLNLSTSEVNVSVVGISEVRAPIKQKCQIELKSSQGKFQCKVSCFVIDKISERMPMNLISREHLEIPKNINLADPNFYKPGEIDLLIGAGLFWELIGSEKIGLGKYGPVLQNSRLGWIISGQLRHTGSTNGNVYCGLTLNKDIQGQLEKFWEIEECGNKISSLSLEEVECEKLFVENTKRDQNGSFIVSIPFKESVAKLGDSRQGAMNRFLGLEKRFNRNSEFRQGYCNFMKEYEESGHMTKVTNWNEQQIAYYLPHHAVMNEHSTTTRLRVVFDGSATTDNGVSLNELQYVGPTIQDDLVTILLRFRTYQFVVCADIARMYRKVWVEKSQRPLQRILWRYDPSEEVGTYELNTVTFGLASSPFLAIRCLKQLANENVENSPLAAKAIAQNFYVDDFLSGANSITEVVELCKEVSQILASGGFELRKWQSNNEEILRQITAEEPLGVVQFGEKGKTKTLGLYWKQDEDVLMYTVHFSRTSGNVTKRTILSEISQIFDPLGLVSACVIIPKIILQQLWLMKVSWDEEIPPSFCQQWIQFREELPLLNSLKIDRHVMGKNPKWIEIHAFSDASTKAYGCCIYLRTIDETNHISVKLLCSKSKVAPIKTLTVPKLELCGALLSAQLVNKVKSAIDCEWKNIYLWSDSTVALNWIRSSAHQFQIFVANRVTQIQNMTTTGNWHYISTDENPADLVSRGVMPSGLHDNTKWFHGPDWLAKEEIFWPDSKFDQLSDLPEKRRQFQTLLMVKVESAFPFDNFSSFQRMKRVWGYCRRFTYNSKNKERKIGPLTVEELEESFLDLVRLAQQQSFPEDYQALKENKNIGQGCLARLNPFMDEKGIVRVGGRLQLSPFNFGKKHPVLLHAGHNLTRCIFRFEHYRLYHAGPQLLLSSIRERIWPIKGRNLAKRVVHACVRCFRAKPRCEDPIMGMLPRDRVTPQPPFWVTGVDYAGPFLMKNKVGRGSSTSKGYVVVFVCFATRAIHLELVTDLTTQAFIATFRRFVSRRGKPQKVFSDNGSTFVGAQSDLIELGKFVQANEGCLVDSFSNEGVMWSFIPAYSPHFGGLWEAGVKSFKFHLKRVIGETKLTYEDFATILSQIEAILNSRPITPLSSDPSDLEALTPAHFLIGRALTAVPDPDLQDVAENRLSRYQKLQRLQQMFWSRWSQDYVVELQSRVKWKTSKQRLQNNQMVLIKDSNSPSLSWALGRIVQLHPGPDGVARVATIRTSKGLIKRSFGKICSLPIDNSVEAETSTGGEKVHKVI